MARKKKEKMNVFGKMRIHAVKENKITWTYDDIKCSQCGNNNAEILIYYTGKRAHKKIGENVFCDECGYMSKIIFIEDRKKDPKHKIWFKKRKDGTLILRKYSKKGYGTYLIACKTGGYSPFGFIKKNELENIPKLMYNFEKRIKPYYVDSRKSYLKVWDDKQKQMVKLV